MARAKKRGTTKLKSVAEKLGRKPVKAVKKVESRKTKKPLTKKAKRPDVQAVASKKAEKKSARKPTIRVFPPTIEQLAHSGEPNFVTLLDKV
jgi:hypothetical protein